MLARIACLFLALLTGCTGSRWARSDPTYAEKYSQHSDNLLQMAKQASDARFVKGRSGQRIGAEYGNSPKTAGASLGLFTFPTSWLEVHGGLEGLIGTGDHDAFGGIGFGARVHTPSRLSAFAGLGAQAVFNEQDLQYDNLDNDDDGLFDEPDEAEIRNYFAAVVPEVGVHFWMTPRFRLTASARYSISTSGRDDDQWLFGLSFSRLNKEETDDDNVDCEEFRSQYIISENAKRDLDQLSANIAGAYDPMVASKVIDMIYDDFDSIANDPSQGEVVSEEGTRRAKLNTTTSLDDVNDIETLRYVTDGGPIIEYRRLGKGIEIAAVREHEWK